MKRRQLAPINVWAVILPLFFSAHAEDLPLEALQINSTTRVDFFHAMQPKPGNSFETQIWSAQIKANATLTSDTSAKFEIRGLAPSGINGDTGNPDSRVLEAYISQRFSDADLRIGKQIVAWGRADGINPTDNLSPRDLATWLPFDDDQRFGAWSARYDMHLQNAMGLTLFFSPFFEPSMTVSPSATNSLPLATPARNAANSQFAVKLNSTSEAFDWSVSYYRGLSLLPTARLMGIKENGPLLEFHYDRLQVLGADFARNFDRFGFRAEAAWTRQYSADDNGPANRRPDFFFVAGLDRTLLDHLYINGQLFGRYVQNFSDPYVIFDSAQRVVAIQNAITMDQQDRVNSGYTMRISYKWLADTLEAEILTINNKTRKNKLTRPTISYAMNDNLKMAVGAIVFQGENDTVFGRKKSNNRLFMELRCTF